MPRYGLDESDATATLFLMDHQFRVGRELFQLGAASWEPVSRDFGRLADWAVVPDDVVLPAVE